MTTTINTPERMCEDWMWEELNMTSIANIGATVRDVCQELVPATVKAEHRADYEGRRQ